MSEDVVSYNPIIVTQSLAEHATAWANAEGEQRRRELAGILGRPQGEPWPDLLQQAERMVEQAERADRLERKVGKLRGKNRVLHSTIAYWIDNALTWREEIDKLRAASAKPVAAEQL